MEIIAFSATTVALLLAVYILYLHKEIDKKDDEISLLFDGLENIADGTHHAARVGDTVVVRPKKGHHDG